MASSISITPSTEPSIARTPDQTITRSPDHQITRSPDPHITRFTQSPRLIPISKGLSSIIPRSRVFSNPRAERAGEKSAPLRFRVSHQSPLNFTLHGISTTPSTEPSIARTPDQTTTRSPDHQITRSPDHQITRCTQSPRLIPRSKGLSGTIPADTCVAQPPSAVVIFSFHQQQCCCQITHLPNRLTQ
jgi:hypothetical protein